MSPLLVIALIIASLIIILFTDPNSVFVNRAARVGGFAFVLYGIILGVIYLMGLAGK